MTSGEITPTKVTLTDMSLQCPTTGEPCPSRVEIARLCTTDYSEDMTVEELENSEGDSKAQTTLLVAHNGLIRRYGCDAHVGSETCPPSIESNNQPAVKGAKRIIKLLLGAGGS